MYTVKLGNVVACVSWNDSWFAKLLYLLMCIKIFTICSLQVEKISQW